jgi:hypothetical protein
VRPSSHGDYREYYDATLRDGVYALYQRDFELFGYAPHF